MAYMNDQLNHLPDFSKAEPVYGKFYDGSHGKKIAVKYQGKPWMIKYPSLSALRNGRPDYACRCIMEYIAGHIMEMLGIDVQKTMLGTMNFEGRKILVCACQDFAGKGLRFYDFTSLKNSMLSIPSNRSEKDLETILEILSQQTILPASILKERFWQMFVADALMANPSRTAGDWGFLFDENTQRWYLAPVFDNENCLLLPGADVSEKNPPENGRTHIPFSLAEPASAIRFQGKKISYARFFRDFQNEDLQKALCQVVPKINLDQIRAFIDSIECLSDLEKEFCINGITDRYNQILKPAYEKAAYTDAASLN